uniref:Gypsy retrotransposon integrase-like protein 1 n=1 Tax=Acanthochromis polyacanthus TaxID=80966 RepID=A0A3Q1EMU4_9TELE
MKKGDWYKVQREDPSLREVISFLEAAVKPHFKQLSSKPPEVRLFLKVWKCLELRDGVLYRKYVDHDSEIYQLVLPERFRDCALKGIHDEVGHLGAERALSLARTRFYWPKMAMAIKERCQTCERCFRRKANPQKAAPMQNILTTYPLELVCMDYLSIEPDSRDTRNVLVITDHFTKFAVAIPTRDQKAKTTAKALWESFIAPYGFPSRLHSDQGRDFESRTIKELCSVIGAEKVRTTPYHPQGNPVERFNRTLLSMLGTLEEKDKHNWRDYVKPLVHAYNCTRNDTTGYSPYELMFGRQPTLPVDFVLGTSPVADSHSTHSDYVHKLRRRLQESYALASDRARKKGEQNKLRFDARVRAAELFAGDRVLVRNVNIRGKHKLADRWERMIHVVVRRISEGPVYVVRPEKGNGPHRTLHRDLLLPCGFLPIDTGPEEKAEVKELRKRNLRSRRVSEESSDQDEDFSVEEDDRCSNRVVEITTKPPRIARNASLSRSIVALNPQATEFTPQVPRLLPAEVQCNQPVDLPESVLEIAGTGDGPGSPIDYVVVDIPESDIPNVPSEFEEPVLEEPVLEETEQVHDQNVSLESGQPRVVVSDNACDEPRRSARERRPPQKFTYDELGKPLILALSSFFESLQTILPQSQASRCDIHFK